MSRELEEQTTEIVAKWLRLDDSRIPLDVGRRVRGKQEREFARGASEEELIGAMAGSAILQAGSAGGTR